MIKDAFYLNEYGLPVIIRNNVKIEWVNLGEGLDGDYDPTAEYDINLLRFDVYRFDGKDWTAIEDGSYCTMIQSNAPYAVLQENLVHFMDTIYDDVSTHGKAKRLGEQLSWTSCKE